MQQVPHALESQAGKGSSGCRGWEARLGEVAAKWAAEKAAAEQRWEDARVSAGAAWQGALDRAQAHGVEQLALAQQRWHQARPL